MNLKQIQALEYLLLKLDPAKKLMVSYQGRILSASFLNYFNNKNESILIDEKTYAHIFDEQDKQYFVTNVKKELMEQQESNSGSTFCIDGLRFDLDNGVTPSLFNELCIYIENKSERYTSTKKFETIVRNVTFFETGKLLPFYLFPDDAEFTPVSLVTREG